MHLCIIFMLSHRDIGWEDRLWNSCVFWGFANIIIILFYYYYYCCCIMYLLPCHGEI